MTLQHLYERTNKGLTREEFLAPLMNWVRVKHLTEFYADSWDFHIKYNNAEGSSGFGVNQSEKQITSLLANIRAESIKELTVKQKTDKVLVGVAGIWDLQLKEVFDMRLDDYPKFLHTIGSMLNTTGMNLLFGEYRDL